MIMRILQLSYLIENYYNQESSSPDVTEDYRQLLDAVFSQVESHINSIEHHGILYYRKFLLKKLKDQ